MPSTRMRIFAAWRAWRSSETSLMASAVWTFRRFLVRRHLQRMELHRLRPAQPVDQPLGAEIVHQEPDRAAMHAVDRHAALERTVEGLQHEPVAAERDDDVGLLRRRFAVALGQLGAGGLRRLGVGRNERDAGTAGRGHGGAACSALSGGALTRR